jgi:hypothetical protein
MRISVALSILTAVVIVSVASGAGGQEGKALVWGKQIGDVKLGMNETDVDYEYGQPVKIEVPWKLPAGKYKNQLAYPQTYVYNGHRLRITFVNRRVRRIETSSTYYRTPTGVGVGTYIPLGPCHTVKGQCVHEWHSFKYIGCDEPAFWDLYTRRAETDLFMNHGRIASISIGDPDVVLLCF